MTSIHRRITICVGCWLALVGAFGFLNARAWEGHDRQPGRVSTAESNPAADPAGAAPKRWLDDPRVLSTWGAYGLMGLSLIPAVGLAIASWRLRRELRSLGTGIGRLSSEKRAGEPGGYGYTELRECARELANVSRWLEQEQGRLTDDASRDALTGLANRRSFLERLTQELASSARTGWPLSLIMVDLDRFKKLNDTYGHQAGDFVLKRAGERMASLVRQTDLVARYGGEEFAVILPHASLAQGMEIAWQLCNALRCDLLVIDQHSVKVSASFGVAELPNGRPGDADALVRAADMALYQAKEQGRDRVVAAPKVDVVDTTEEPAAAEDARTHTRATDHRASVDADTMALMGSTFSLLQVIPDKHRVAHDMLQQISAALECDRASLYMLDPESDVLRPAACVGVTAHGRTGRGAACPAELSRWFEGVRATGDTPNLRSVEITRVRSRDGDGLTLRVPLSVYDELIGAIEVSGVPDGLQNAARPRRLLSAVCLIGSTVMRICDRFADQEERWTSLTEALCNMLQTGKRYKQDHAARVSALSISIAKTLGQADEEELRVLRVAALVHDIGEIAVPERIREKRGRLRTNEWRQLQDHARLGADIVSGAFRMQRLAKIVLHHHEHYDGGGYPDRLVGEQIPLESRIIAVADAYVAMTSARPHRDRLDESEAIATIIHASGGQFDPVVVNAFLQCSIEAAEAPAAQRRHADEAKLAHAEAGR